MKSNQDGFTLLELMALIVLGFVLLGVSFTLLHTTDYTNLQATNKRRLQLALLAQAISLYERETGKQLEGLPQKPTLISSEKDGYDLCKVLVPKYLDDLPYDPLAGTKILPESVSGPASSCAGEGVAYATGHLISGDKQGHITLKPIINDNANELSVTL